QCPGASLGKRPSQTKKKKKKRRQSKTVEAVDGGSDLFSPKKRLEPCSEDESSDIDDPGASLGKRPSQTKKKKKKRRRKEDSPRQLKQQAWAYPSLKPLAAWTRDLCQRVDQFAHWAETAQPPNLFWLSGFTFPNGFLTAVLQSAARQHNISIDTLSWEFIVSTVDDSNLLYPPKDGVFVRGLYLEGAGWDKKNSCLVEAEPMQMVCPIPTIHFKPVENRKKMAKSMYLCPCYYFPVRSGGAGRASFVVGVELKSGAVTQDHWIKRGTALLMSLDN
ncbi:Dynein heavy chain 2%2C axonemal, partial [Scomber scombrus]